MIYNGKQQAFGASGTGGSDRSKDCATIFFFGGGGVEKIPIALPNNVTPFLYSTLSGGHITAKCRPASEVLLSKRGFLRSQ